MVIKYNVDIKDEAIIKDLERLINLVFKLLPRREEGEDWLTPLNNLIVEFCGLSNLLEDHYNLFVLLSKLESLITLSAEDDFLMFRKVIFECLNIISDIKKDIAGGGSRE